MSVAQSGTFLFIYGLNQMFENLFLVYFFSYFWFVYIALPDVSKPATLFTFAFELEVRVNITSVCVSGMIQKCTIAETPNLFSKCLKKTLF